MGIYGVAAPAEGVVVVEGGDVVGGRGGEGQLVATHLLGRVEEGGWERPPRCGMCRVGSDQLDCGWCADHGWCAVCGCGLCP